MKQAPVRWEMHMQFRRENVMGKTCCIFNSDINMDIKNIAVERRGLDSYAS
jgi:hypothetical protein